MSSNSNEGLQNLVEAMKKSHGVFRPFLARYSYVEQRDRLIKELRSSFPGVLAELELNESVRRIYGTIREYLGDKQPDALMIWGWDSLKNIDKLLVAMGYVREEFRKHCPLPMVFWVDRKISGKFIRLIPDFHNWTNLTIFEPTNEDLINFIQQTSENVYEKVLESRAGIFLNNTALDVGDSTYQDLIGARQKLANRGISLEPELEASLEFVLGRLIDSSEETALDHYKKSLQLWQQLNNFVQVAQTCYDIGLWWQSYAVRHRAEKHKALEKACFYFQQSVEAFETASRPDLVAKFINTWGEVLQTLERWDELETVAKRAIELHQTYSSPFREALAYDFLAEFELAKSNYKEAKKLAQTSIEIFNKTLTTTFPSTSEKEEIILDFECHNHLVRYLFSLAKAEKYLDESQSSIANFEQAKNMTQLEYSGQFYIDILTELQAIYGKNKEYLKAFESKQEKIKIEQIIGVKAFIGANPLGDIKENINPALTQSQQSIFQKEIVASGRQFDVENLMQRISRPDYKLIVIYGQLGVGKSSVLQAGLIPVLEQKSIGNSGVVVVLQRVYVNWISELGKILAKQLQITQHLAINSESLTSTEAIFAQLKNNDKSNLLTVLIFDQFEDFFFVNSEPRDKQEFGQFLQNCLEIPFVKIVFSLREDYIYYLSDFNNDILGVPDSGYDLYLLAISKLLNNKYCKLFSFYFHTLIQQRQIFTKNIHYYLGNFKPSEAKSAIQELTEKSQFKIDSELTKKLVEDLAKELGEIRPIELQIVGAQLQRENIMTLAKYQELGDNPKAKLVGQYLESAVRDCGKENEKSAWLVLWLLTDENNTRTLKNQAELVEESKLNLDTLELVLNIFVGSGLVFLLLEKPANRYQLVHDYLVELIRQRKEACQGWKT